RCRRRRWWRRVVSRTSRRRRAVARATRRRRSVARRRRRRRTDRAVAADVGHVAQGTRQLTTGLLEPHQREHQSRDDDDQAYPEAKSVSLVQRVTTDSPWRRNDEDRQNDAEGRESVGTQTREPRRKRQLEV